MPANPIVAYTIFVTYYQQASVPCTHHVIMLSLASPGNKPLPRFLEWHCATIDFCLLQCLSFVFTEILSFLVSIPVLVWSRCEVKVGGLVADRNKQMPQP